MATLPARRECVGSCAKVAAVRRRAAIERQIEALIDQLDVLDGDANLEDDGTAEPSLGSSFTYAGGAGDDCEDTSPEWHGGAA